MGTSDGMVDIWGPHLDWTNFKIAADRAANEPAVRIAKALHYVKRGLHSRQSYHRLDKAWAVWAFTSNYVIKEAG